MPWKVAEEDPVDGDLLVFERGYGTDSEALDAAVRRMAALGEESAVGVFLVDPFGRPRRLSSAEPSVTVRREAWARNVERALVRTRIVEATSDASDDEILDVRLPVSVWRQIIAEL